MSTLWQTEAHRRPEIHSSFSRKPPPLPCRGVRPTREAPSLNPSSETLSRRNGFVPSTPVPAPHQPIFWLPNFCLLTSVSLPCC